ncbi:MAG: GPW/gp25 family protein [Oscillospiraceae bacterium]|nr:GPW/gp25 family protein [Oscillospiraceae bacterium]
MAYLVSAADLSGLRLCERDPVRSVLQNCALILGTRRGTVPFYREFGLPQLFLDKPGPAAVPLACAAVKEAIEAFEPRVRVLDVTFSEDPAQPGQLRPSVEVEILA